MAYSDQRFQKGDRVILRNVHPTSDPERQKRKGQLGTVAEVIEGGGQYRVEFDCDRELVPQPEWWIDPCWLAPAAPNCCENEQRDINGGCINCGDPCL